MVRDNVEKVEERKDITHYHSILRYYEHEWDTFSNMYSTNLTVFSVGSSRRRRRDGILATRHPSSRQSESPAPWQFMSRHVLILTLVPRLVHIPKYWTGSFRLRFLLEEACEGLVLHPNISFKIEESLMFVGLRTLSPRFLLSLQSGLLQRKFAPSGKLKCCHPCWWTEFLAAEKYSLSRSINRISDTTQAHVFSLYHRSVFEHSRAG